MKNQILFVYGTLLPKQPNNGRLQDAKFIGYDQIVGYRLYDRGFAPAVGPGGPHEIVKGAVYEVDADRLAVIDRFEGHPTVYLRRGTLTAQGRRAWLYDWANWEYEPLFARVPSGDWAAHVISNNEEYTRLRDWKYDRSRRFYNDWYDLPITPKKNGKKKVKTGLWDNSTTEQKIENLPAGENFTGGGIWNSPSPEEWDRR